MEFYTCADKLWGILTLWNQDHKWYVSVGSLIGLLATVFLCCQTAMLNKHLLWDKVINAETGWLQPVSATSSTTPPHSQAHLSLPQSSHLPTFALPLYLKLTFIERCPGLSKVSVVSNYWYFPNLWISTMKPQAKSFSGRLYLVFFKWNWTELLNFCQLELFPPLLNHLKTTCFPLVFPPVTGVLFF